MRRGLRLVSRSAGSCGGFAQLLRPPAQQSHIEVGRPCIADASYQRRWAGFAASPPRLAVPLITVPPKKPPKVLADDWCCTNPQCQTPNFRWIEECKKCRTAMPEAALDAKQTKSWRCKRCYKINDDRTTTRCNRCFFDPDPNAEKIPAQPRHKIPEKWMCVNPVCATLNIYSSPRCTKCSVAYEQKDWWCGCGTKVFGSRDRCFECGLGYQPSWKCRKCSSASSVSVNRCHDCGSDRFNRGTLDIGGGGGGGPPRRSGGGGGGGYATAGYDDAPPRGAPPSRRPPVQAAQAPAAPAAVDDGGEWEETPQAAGPWLCLNCKKVNSEGSKVCSKCDKLRPTAIAEVVAQQAGGTVGTDPDADEWDADVGTAAPTTPLSAFPGRGSKPTGRDRAPPPTESYGDEGFGAEGGTTSDNNWQCHTCGTLNFRTRKTCWECGEAARVRAANQAAVVGGPTEDMEGFEDKTATYLNLEGNPGLDLLHRADWVCGKCFTKNYGGRGTCKRCEAPKSVATLTRRFSAAQPTKPHTL